MPQTDARPRKSRGLLGPRNLVVLGAAVVVLVVGYLTLSAGHPSLAAVLLVIGYCVLFPLAIAL
jgi:heme O synthase-like polyprenyltransferase